jgi:3-oxoacyl-[acyl-carrier-protein] synthase-3
MALLNVKGVRIVGFSAGVPKQVVSKADTISSSDYDASDFIEKTGIKEVRVSDDFTASDLCFAAAEKLIGDLGWEKSEIEGLFFVSQHPDYILPATSCILQDRLGLSRECYSMDISLGCSGWVYGLNAATALLAGHGLKKALLLCGDARKRARCDFDPLFGFAGTVTALEYSGNDTDEMNFHVGTDGSGYDAIIIPDGGSRNPATADSFKMEEVDGKMMHRMQTRMKGMDVFSFAISTAPKSIKKLMELEGKSASDYDYIVLHQANTMINEMIRKKIKATPEQLPYSLHEFGNTSMASIPLTIVTQLKGKVENREASYIACGFGVGLSWGTVSFKTNKLVISELVEL